MAFFKVLKQSKKSQARLGLLSTPHGDVLTPAFVPVATKGTLKTIPPKDIADIGTQLAFVNTFHLTLHPGVDVLQRFGGIHAYSKLPIPLMSDSAGFQVFSLGRKKNARQDVHDNNEVQLLRIGDEGVMFRVAGGKEIFFTPELSIENQEKIGADIILAFDECIYHEASYAYTKEATVRTHEWLVRSIKQKKRKDQFLYGIVQGGVFQDLRKLSAAFVAKQYIDGIAIGGVSVGETKKEMRDQVKWVTPLLPPELPRHLLGIGRVEDIKDFVPQGLDTFDCVEPARLARTGVVFQRKGARITHIDLTRAKHAKEKAPIQKGCLCYTCTQFSLSFLHHLFKERELLGYYLATYHNLFFFEQLFAALRKSIQKGLL